MIIQLIILIYYKICLLPINADETKIVRDLFVIVNLKGFATLPITVLVEKERFRRNNIIKPQQPKVEDLTVLIRLVNVQKDYLRVTLKVGYVSHYQLYKEVHIIV